MDEQRSLKLVAKDLWVTMARRYFSINSAFLSLEWKQITSEIDKRKQESFWTQIELQTGTASYAAPVLTQHKSSTRFALSLSF